jgi:hypothetical protein
MVGLGPTPHESIHSFVANFMGTLRAGNVVPETPSAIPLSTTQSPTQRHVWNTRMLLKDTFQTALCCAGARRSSLTHITSRWMRAQLPMPSFRPLIYGGRRGEGGTHCHAY